MSVGALDLGRAVAAQAGWMEALLVALVQAPT